MRQLHIWLFLFLLLPVLGQSAPISQPQSPIFFQEISLEEARRMASREDKLFFIYFSAGWCMPCKWMEDNTFWDEKLVAYVNENYLAVKVDIDKVDNRSLQEQFEVRQLPTVLIFSAAGVLLDKVEAAVEAPRLLRLLKKHNHPSNHRISTATPGSDDAMQSPKPQLGFSRPALVPDTDDLAKPKEQPQYISGRNRANNVVQGPVPMPPSNYHAPVRNTSQEMAPRQVNRYGVQIKVVIDYQAALQEVQRLEDKFNKVVEAYPYEVAGETVYAVVVGSFVLKSEARKLLIYLNRNDINGQIINIGAE